MNVTAENPTVEDVTRVAHWLHETSLRDYAWFVMGVTMELPLAVLASIKVSDVRDPAKQFRERVAIRVGRRTWSRPMNPSAVRALEEYLTSRTPVRATAPLFPSQKGGQLGHKSMSIILLKAVGACLQHPATWTAFMKVRVEASSPSQSDRSVSLIGFIGLTEAKEEGVRRARSFSTNL